MEFAKPGGQRACHQTPLIQNVKNCLCQNFFCRRHLMKDPIYSCELKTEATKVCLSVVAESHKITLCRRSFCSLNVPSRGWAPWGGKTGVWDNLGKTQSCLRGRVLVSVVTSSKWQRVGWMWPSPTWGQGTWLWPWLWLCANTRQVCADALLLLHFVGNCFGWLYLKISLQPRALLPGEVNYICKDDCLPFHLPCTPSLHSTEWLSIWENKK